jgi:hypothetical protein
MDSEKSISHTIEEKLTGMLRTWKSGMGDKANSFLSAQLSQYAPPPSPTPTFDCPLPFRLTVLLTMVGEGSVAVDEVVHNAPPPFAPYSSQLVSTTQQKILTTLNDPRLKKSASDIARDKLTSVLVTLRESEEALTGKTVSGFHFFQEFNLESLSDAQGSLSQTVKEIANHTGVS